jgi:hypothetical protein
MLISKLVAKLRLSKLAEPRMAKGLVDQQRLAVQHARLVFEHAHPGLEQRIVVGARGEVDQARVRLLRDHHPRVEAAHRRRGQRVQGGRGRHEVGRGYPDALVGDVDRGQAARWIGSAPLSGPEGIICTAQTPGFIAGNRSAPSGVLPEA